MTNANFHPRVLFYETYAKRDPEFLEVFLFYLMRDEHHWREYTEFLRMNERGRFFEPNRYKVSLRYVMSAYDKKTGKNTFCQKTREMAAEWLDAYQRNKN